MDVMYTTPVPSPIPKKSSVWYIEVEFWWSIVISYFIAEEADDPNINSSSEDSPLVAISSITAGGIIVGFVVAFVAYRLCRNRRDAEEPFFGENLFLFTLFC